MAQQGLYQSQDLSLRQEQVLAPHQIQSLEILTVPLMDLQTRINQELESNPTLERLDTGGEQLAGDPMEGLGASGSNNDAFAGEIAEKDAFLANLMQIEESWRDYVPPSHARQYSTTDDEERRMYFFDSLTSVQSLEEELLEQLRTSDADTQTRVLVELLIGSLDTYGYLRTPLADIAQLGGCDIPTVEAAMHLLQSFEPPGVAARDLRECLLLQLERRGRKGGLAWKVVDRFLEQMSKNRIPEVARSLGISVNQLNEVWAEIRQLQPHPGNASGPDNVQYVSPEATVKFDEQTQAWKVTVSRDASPRIRISQMYMKLLEDPTTPADVKAYIKDKVNNGNQLIKSLGQRTSTIHKIADVIVARQVDFLEQGEEGMRPMTMSEVADEIGMHETTVSRAVANKFIQTPHGLLPMKHFFSTGFTTDEGEALSSHSIKHKINAMISDEDSSKPLSDQAIVELLKAEGLDVARRTVAKYREELNIPSSHRRKSYTT